MTEEEIKRIEILSREIRLKFEEVVGLLSTYKMTHSADTFNLLDYQIPYALKILRFENDMKTQDENK